MAIAMYPSSLPRTVHMSQRTRRSRDGKAESGVRRNGGEVEPHELNLIVLYALFSHPVRSFRLLSRRSPRKAHCIPNQTPGQSLMTRTPLSPTLS